MTSIVQCSIDGCDWQVEGLRDMPEDVLVAGPRIAEVMGVTPTFYLHSWMMSEGNRIEDAIKEHLTGHTMLEALTTIARLKADVHNLTDDCAALRERKCERLCCSSRS